MLMSSDENPWEATAPATSAATAPAPGSLPSLAFVVISYAETALTRMTLSSSAIAARARRVRLRSPSSHQSSACVSSRSRTSLPAIEFVGRQRLEEGGGHPGATSHRPELAPRRQLVHERQADDRRVPARNHDVVARLCLFEELGQVGLGDVDRI